MRKSNYLFPALALGLTAVSCQDYDAGFTEADFVKKEYSENFEKTFGKIDPNQDWSMAQQVNATISLSGLNGKHMVSVYTCAPFSGKSAILYQTEAQGGDNLSFTFDAPKNNKEVYVMIKGENGLLPLSDYFTVEGGSLIAAPNGTITRSASSISLSDKVEKSVMGTFTGVSFKKIDGTVTEDGSNAREFSNWDYLVQNAEHWPVYTKGTDEGTFLLWTRSGEPGSYTASSAPVGKNEWDVKIASLSTKSYAYEYNGKYYIPYNGQVYPTHWGSVSGPTDYPDLYTLSGVTTEWGPSWRFSDIDPIVGVHSSKAGWEGMSSPNTFLSDENQKEIGVFSERAHADCSGELRYCNLAKWWKELNAINGAEYIVDTESPVTIDVMYGGTDNDNQFGYFYYQDGATFEEICNRPHYLLMESAMMNDNLKLNDASYAEGGMALTSKMTAYCRTYDNVDGYDDAAWNTAVAAANHKITGRHYELAYFGTEGTTTQGVKEFPAGTHIVFFLIQCGKSKTSGKGWQIEYSRPDLNKHQGKLHTAGSSCHGNSRYSSQMDGLTAETGEIDAVTYRWGDQIVLGFEDRGGDDDMNDILFFVNGNFRNKTDLKELKEETEDVYEWMIACEDLGGSFDYDFNDVVFGVKKYDTQITIKEEFYENGVLVSTTPKKISSEHSLVVTPYAAGGTLKTYIVWNDGSNDNTFEESHFLINGSTGTAGSMPILNARSKGKSGKPSVFHLTTEQATAFTMATGAGGFSVKVEDAEGAITTVTSPTSEYNKNGNKAPQMIVLPKGWLWPTEGTNIDDAYNHFHNWAQNADETQWIGTWNSNKIDQYVVK